MDKFDRRVARWLRATSAFRRWATFRHAAANAVALMSRSRHTPWKICMNAHLLPTFILSRVRYARLLFRQFRAGQSSHDIAMCRLTGVKSIIFYVYQLIHSLQYKWKNIFQFVLIHFNSATLIKVIHSVCFLSARYLFHKFLFVIISSRHIKIYSCMYNKIWIIFLIPF